MRIGRRLIVILALLAMALPPVAADAPKTGKIVGVVVDPNDKPVADCIVTAQQNAEKMREGIQGTTDKDGKFELDDVPEGDYNLNVRTADAKGKAIKSLTVAADKTTDVGKLKLKMK